MVTQSSGTPSASAGTLRHRRGATVWLTGLPASGKTTLAHALERSLTAERRLAYRLDGDELRTGLCSDLGFDRASRSENVRRAAHVAAALADAGVTALVALVSPYEGDRRRARSLHAHRGLPFLEVFLDTPLEVCRERDPKGLYEQASRGKLQRMTGVDDPYERPMSSEVRLELQPVEVSVQIVLDALNAASPPDDERVI